MTHMKKDESAESRIIRQDFDRIAAVERRRWDHNRHYYPLMTRLAAKGSCETAVEVGCGTGEMARMLACRFTRVIGIDLSEGMLERAKKAGGDNIQYLHRDVMAHAFVSGETDCIISAATAHHLPCREFLNKAKNALAPGGRLIILDLYKRASLAELLLAAIAIPANAVMNIIRNGRVALTKKEREAWRHHAKHDRYMTIAEIRREAGKLLPGAKIRRLFYWRYLLYYEKPRTVTDGQTDIANQTGQITL